MGIFRVDKNLANGETNKQTNGIPPWRYCTSFQAGINWGFDFLSHWWRFCEKVEFALLIKRVDAFFVQCKLL